MTAEHEASLTPVNHTELKSIFNGQEPFVVEQVSSAMEQVSAVTEQIPADTEQVPADTEQVPADNAEQLQAVTEESQAAMDQVPADNTEQLPAATEQEPPDIEQEPPDTIQEPAARGQEPAATEQESAVTEQEPAVTEQVSAATEQESAVTEQVPAVTEQEPANQGENSTQHQKRDASLLVSQDGTPYEWDSVQRGWFPKLNEDMIAAYTMSFGSGEVTNEIEDDEAVDKTSSSESERKRSEREVREVSTNKPVKRAKNETPTWFKVEESQNKHVYVSNLPSDVTELQFTQLMRKCGVIAEHEDGQPKVKLYRTAEGDVKGDALCTYLKVESVPYAELILDGYDLNGHKLKVQPAQFEMKGTYNASLKPKKRNKNKKNRAEKLVKWRDPYYDRPKNERVVILKNVFTAEELQRDPLLAEQVREQMKTECDKCGKVKKAIVSERHPEGVVSVMFVEHSGADKCVQVMNGRRFGGRVMECSLWDGETCYVGEETEEEMNSRLELWEEYLKK